MTIILNGTGRRASRELHPTRITISFLHSICLFQGLGGPGVFLDR